MKLTNKTIRMMKSATRPVAIRDIGRTSSPQEEVGIAQLDCGGNSTASPVMDALNSARPIIEQTSELACATESLDKQSVSGDVDFSVHALLNTTFNAKANTMLNNKVFSFETIRAMHDTTARLYEAARVLRGLTTPTEIARFLNVSPQLVNNWERRGMSKAGILDVQEKIGCSAVWLMTGQGSMLIETSHANGSQERLKKGQNLPAEATRSLGNGASIHSSEEMAGATSPSRLRAALSDKGLTTSELASVAGVSEMTAGRWLSGEGPEITLAQAAAIQHAFGVNVVWLTKGKGEPGVAVRYSDEFAPIPVTNWRAVPVVGHAQLGDDGFWADLELPVGIGDGYVDFPSKDPNAYALRCVGDSMRPRIKDGEYVIVEPGQPIQPGDEVLVKSLKGQVMIKEFLYQRGGRVHLRSVNDLYKPLSFATEAVEKMHFVRAICRPTSWRPE